MQRIDEFDRQALLDSLSRGADVWWLRPDDVPAPELEYCRSVLSADESARCQRFRFSDDRRLYLLAHAMLRQVLSAYADIAPGALEFSTGTHGRPELADFAGQAGLRFNLSHTPGLAACIVSQGDACGVDVEAIAARRNVMGIAGRMFADEELAQLRQLAGRAFLERFFTLWTLREAWCKARGTGLMDSRRDIGFQQLDGQGWRLLAADGAPGDWQVDVRPIGTTHMLASAIEINGQSQQRVEYRPFAFPAAGR